MENTNPNPVTPVIPETQKDKYRIFSAIGPAVRAIRYSAGLIGLAVLVTVVIQVIQLLLNRLFITPPVTPGRPVFIPYWALLAYAPFIVIGVLVAIFTALVLADGAHQERESFGLYIRSALRLWWRVVVSYIVAGLAIILPAIGVSIIIGAGLATASLIDSPVLRVVSVILAFVGGIGVFVWALATYIRYSLVGFIAMFEPELPVSLIRKRSRQLLGGTGEWFIVKLGLFSTLVILILTFPVLIIILKTPQIQPSILFQAYISLISIPYSIFANAMLIVLYLNRRATKPSLETTQANKFGWKMVVLIVLTVIGTITLLASAPTLLRRHRLQQEQVRAQQAAQQKAALDNQLAVYTNKAHGYALKLPKDFVLVNSTPEVGDVLRSKAANTPIIVLVKTLPKDPNLVYVNDSTTSKVFETGIVQSFDNALQQLTGSPDSTTVAGDINIPGTNHKRAIFAVAQTQDANGQALSMRVIIVPKNDGTSLSVTILGPVNSGNQLDPLIDNIFKSISLRP